MTNRLAPTVVYGCFWVVAVAFSISTFEFQNDQFDRVSRARQIAQYGDLPFRDFFDPGYFAEEFASAGLQRLLGDNLLGELLLDTAFIATGCLVVLILARRASGSLAVGCCAAALALLSMPRSYDYDKVLFYPLGVLLCWRYVDLRRARDAVILGAGVAAGGLFRYDTAAYVGLPAAVTMCVVHAKTWPLLTRRLGLVAAGATLVALPGLILVQNTAGLGSAIDQVMTYARREVGRTRMTALPRVRLGEHLVSVAPPPSPANVVVIRWVPTVDDNGRQLLSTRYRLAREIRLGDPGDRTWSYLVEDETPENIRRLLNDPSVEDTSGIDRSRSRLVREPWRARLMRGLPIARLRILPAAWNADNADAVLYYCLFALPAAAGIVLIARGRSGDSVSQMNQAHLTMLILLCLILDIFILREPIRARVGGIAGPAAVMAAWLLHEAWRARRVIVKLASTLALALVIWSLSEMGAWNRTFSAMFSHPMSAGLRLSEVSTEPPAMSLLPSGRLEGIVTYLRACTRPEDRVFASWFVPELYFFAQRGFAAGMAVSFGSHWSEPRYQQRMVDTLAKQSVPVVILDVENHWYFQAAYPRLDEYLRQRYDVAGDTDFGNAQAGPPRYRVLVERNRTPMGTDPVSSLPCFVSSGRAS